MWRSARVGSLRAAPAQGLRGPGWPSGLTASSDSLASTAGPRGVEPTFTGPGAGPAGCGPGLDPALHPLLRIKFYRARALPFIPSAAPSRLHGGAENLQRMARPTQLTYLLSAPLRKMLAVPQNRVAYQSDPPVRKVEALGLRADPAPPLSWGGVMGTRTRKAEEGRRWRGPGSVPGRSGTAARAGRASCWPGSLRVRRRRRPRPGSRCPRDGRDCPHSAGCRGLQNGGHDSPVPCH